MVNCCIAQHLNNDDALWCAECGSLVTGAMIGDYRLISYVGNGSSADVYLAEQPSLNKRKVVIKILHRSWSEARVRNFQREAAALAFGYRETRLSDVRLYLYQPSRKAN